MYKADPHHRNPLVTGYFPLRNRGVSAKNHPRPLYYYVKIHFVVVVRCLVGGVGGRWVWWLVVWGEVLSNLFPFAPPARAEFPFLNSFKTGEYSHYFTGGVRFIDRSIRLDERDYLILRTVYRFRFCLGRHIKVFADYGSLRATDRRLKLLVEAGFLERKKYIFGIPYLYTLSHKGRTLLGVNKRADTIRLDTVTHDIYVLEAVIYYMAKYNVSLTDIESEKELHIKDGFSTRKHYPDFVVSSNGKTLAVEIELNPKAKERVEKNIRENYLNYDSGVWISDNLKVLRLLNNLISIYSNIDILNLEEVLAYTKGHYV